MRKLIFIFIALSCNNYTIAQIDTFVYATQNIALQNIWGNLDTSEIETGILIDKFPSINNPILFQNRTLNDSVINFNHWISFYNSLYWGKNDTIRNIPSLNEFVEIADSIGKSSLSIPLGMLNYNFNQLNDSALIRNQIQIVDNHKFYRSNSSSNESPYLTRTIFNISPVYIVCNTLSVCFNLTTNFIFTNRSDTIIKYEIRYNNDTNYTEFNTNVVFCKHFDNFGPQILTFRCTTYNNDTFYCKSLFNIVESNHEERSSTCGDLIEPDEGPTVINYIHGLPGSYYNNTPTPNSILTGRYAVWHGCNLSAGLPNTTLVRKPILFITGFNPKNSKTMLCWEDDIPFQSHSPQNNNNLTTVAEKIWRGSYYETFNGATWPDFRGEISNTSFFDLISGNNDAYTNLKMQFNGTKYLQKLRENGFDVWIMAVDNGEDKAQNNALLVAQMIKLINSHYLGIGQTEELIVTGYSAGAWASRFALTMMEKYHAENLNTPNVSLYPHHRTKLWLSYEGEFYGANTPIGFQEFVKFMSNTANTNPDFVTAGFGGVALSPLFAPLILAGFTPLVDNTIFNQTNTILNNPASQQLSRYVPGYGTNKSFASLQLNLEIYALNPASRGYPVNCRKISLAQGSGVGVETTNGGNYANRFAPEGIMFEVEQKPYLPLTFGVLPARFATSRWNKVGASTIFRGKTGFRTFLAGIPIAFVQTGTETIVAGNYKGWDYCPGSTQATSNILYNNLLFIKDPINIFNTFNYTQTMHSFAPTAGMFDIRTPASGYTLEEDVFENLDAKYDFFQIRKLQNGLPEYSSGHRYGYPHLINGNNVGGYTLNSSTLTPFDAIAAVGDKNQYPTILENHFHVDDFQPDFLDFLLGEMADANVYVQNRDIGNNTPNYIAGFHAKNTVYCGSNVYQKYCNEWRDKVGEVIINQGTQVDFRGTEIVFTTGVSVVNSGSIHARLGYTGNCAEDMSQRNSNNSSAYEYSIELQSHENNRKDESSIKHNTNSTVNIYPNPSTANNAVVVELLNSKEGLLTMYDVTGKLIITNKIYEGKNQMHLPNDCKGIYFIKIQNYENNTFNKKLVVY